MSFETPHGNGLSITAMTVEPRQGCPLGGVLLLPKLQRHVTGESKKEVFREWKQSGAAWKSSPLR